MSPEEDTKSHPNQPNQSNQQPIEPQPTAAHSLAVSEEVQSAGHKHSDEVHSDEAHDLEYFEDGQIASGHAKVPTWLLVAYPLVALWGFSCLFLFFNGSHSWLDRGYWGQLQRAANTTMPFENHAYPKLPKQPIVPESELSQND